MWYIVIVLHNFLFTKFPTVFDGFLGEFYHLPFNQIAFNEFVFLTAPALDVQPLSTAVIKLLQPGFKFPAKIEMALNDLTNSNSF